MDGTPNPNNQRRRGLRASGSRVKKFRMLAGITQEVLAGEADISERVIRKAENGGVVDANTLRCIASALCGFGLTVDVFDLQSDAADTQPNSPVASSIAQRWFSVLAGQTPPKSLLSLLARDVVLNSGGQQSIGHGDFLRWLSHFADETKTYQLSLLRTAVGESDAVFKLQLARHPSYVELRVHWLEFEEGCIRVIHELTNASSAR